MRNMKLAVKISSIVIIILTLGLIILWQAINARVSSLMKEEILKEMNDAVETRSEIAEQYVRSAEAYIIGYGQSLELQEALMEPGNVQAAEKAQQFTDNYALVNQNLENVYLAEFHAGKGHLEQLAELDNRFHEIMYEACDSKILEHELKDLHQYVLRVRKKTLSNVNRGPKSNEEHKKIMEAIRAGEAESAGQLARQHMLNAYENMVKNGLHEAYEKEKEHGQD